MNGMRGLPQGRQSRAGTWRGSSGEKKRVSSSPPLPLFTTPHHPTKQMWVGVTMGTAYHITPRKVFNFLTGSFVSLHHGLPAKQRRGSAGAKPGGALGEIFRLDLKRKIYIGVVVGGVAAAAVARNLLCLPAHFDVPEPVIALKCHGKPHWSCI